MTYLRLRGGGWNKKYSKPAPKREKMFPGGNKWKSLHRGETPKKKKADASPKWVPEQTTSTKDKSSVESKKKQKSSKKGFMDDIEERARQRQWTAQKKRIAHWNEDAKVSEWRVEKPWGDLYKKNLENTKSKGSQRTQYKRRGSSNLRKTKEDPVDLQAMLRDAQGQQRSFYVNGFKGGVRFTDGQLSFETASCSEYGQDVFTSESESNEGGSDKASMDYKEFEAMAMAEQEAKRRSAQDVLRYEEQLLEDSSGHHSPKASTKSMPNRSKVKEKKKRKSHQEKKDSSVHTQRYLSEKHTFLYMQIGVAQNATVEEISKAYRRAALRFHPDKLSKREDVDKEAALKKFKLIQNAYEILTDSEKRRVYDSYGMKGVENLENGLKPSTDAAPATVSLDTFLQNRQVYQHRSRSASTSPPFEQDPFAAFADELADRGGDYASLNF